MAKKKVKTLSGKPAKRGKSGNPGKYKKPVSKKQMRFFFWKKVPFKSASGKVMINKKGKIVAKKKKK